MSADTCPRCGRERGWGLTQCSPRDHESCLGFLRDLAEAKAEVERLRANLAHENHCAVRYCHDANIATREADELRRLAWEWCIDAKTCADYGYHALGDVLRLRTEVDELRALAWEWCIEARSGREALEPHERHYSKLYHEKLRIEEERDELRAQLQRLTDDAYEVDHRGNYSEPPIESLGPVPECVPGNLRRCVEWFVCDAARRGARLEGDDR